MGIVSIIRAMGLSLHRKVRGRREASIPDTSSSSTVGIRTEAGRELHDCWSKWAWWGAVLDAKN